jgi:hypothetical protein
METFQKLEHQIARARSYVRDPCVFILIGMKNDTIVNGYDDGPLSSKTPKNDQKNGEDQVPIDMIYALANQ